MADIIEFEFTVTRDDSEEITFAEVSGQYVKRIFEEEKTNDQIVLGAVRRAVKKWSKTEVGRAAINEASNGFNIGDLIGYLDTDQDLTQLLMEEGIVTLSIECMSREDLAFQWKYDTRLYVEDQEDDADGA